MTGPNEALIAKRAYEIWEGEGRPHGKDHEHWLKAVAELSTSIVAEPVVLRPAKPAAPKMAAPKAIEPKPVMAKAPIMAKAPVKAKEAVTAPARVKTAPAKKK